MPRLASGIRVMVLTPCPMMNIACTLSGWLTWSFGSNVASNQRVRRNARRFHQRLVREARFHPVVVHFPHPAPMPPGVFGETVIERQRRHVEAEIGGALHIGVAAKDVGAGAGVSDIAGGKKQKAAGADIRRAGGELGLSHRPDQRRRLLLGEGFGDVLDLRFGQAGDALDLVRRPLRRMLADFVDAVDALAQEFLVFPAIFENVPKHSVDRGECGYRDERGHTRSRARRSVSSADRQRSCWRG